jgi:hypothetical protein
MTTTTGMRGAFGMMAVGLLLSAAAQARADLITQHASTTISIDAMSSLQRVIFDKTELGTTSHSLSRTITLTDPNGDTTIVNASASANVSNPWVLVTNTDVKMDFSPSPTSGGSATSRGAAGASWQDILFLSSTDPNVVGQTLRLTFVVSGSLLNEPSIAEPYTQKSVQFNTGFLSSSRTVEVEDGDPPVTPSGLGFDPGTFHTSGHSYSGEFHVDVPLYASNYISGIPGSIYFRMDASVLSDAFVNDGSIGRAPPIAETAGSDPLQFMSITLPDKGNVTPESLGVSVTFDSGLISPNLLASSVPEPSSLILVTTGAGCLVVYGWRRRRRQARA